MSCQVIIHYVPTLDQTKLSKTKEFEAMPAIQQADALRDALHDLTLLYNATVKLIGKD